MRVNRRSCRLCSAPDEVVRFLEAIPSLKSRTALTTVYAAGLRVSEVVVLKISNIDSHRKVIRIEQGKGGKDRYVMLSPQLLRILRSYWRLTRPKRWLFPGCQTCVDAPIDASGFLRLEHVVRCCRVSGLMMMRLFTRRGPVWRSADRVQIGVAR